MGLPGRQVRAAGIRDLHAGEARAELAGFDPLAELRDSLPARVGRDRSLGRAAMAA